MVRREPQMNMNNSAELRLDEIMNDSGDATMSRTDALIVALRSSKNVFEFVEHFANQYYIYGENRSEFMCWSSALRSSIERDSFHFKQFDNDYDLHQFMIRHGRDQFHFTRRVLSNVFKDISEYTAYAVSESEQIDEVLTVLKDIFYLYEKRVFKNKLNGGEKSIQL